MELPKRKKNRLPDFDYSTPTAYFITLCTHNRQCFLSRIVGAIHESPAVQKTVCGQMVERIIRNLPQHLGVQIDKYVIMPNHIHMLVRVVADTPLRAIRESPLRVRSVVSKAVGYIKMNASKEIHTRYGDMPIWQRGFYDHVVRSEKDYRDIWEYIEGNPGKWKEDELYTSIP